MKEINLIEFDFSNFSIKETELKLNIYIRKNIEDVIFSSYENFKSNDSKIGNFIKETFKFQKQKWDK